MAGTTNLQFWCDPNGVAHDTPFGTDVDRFLLAFNNTQVDTTRQDFGTSGAKTIIVDPQNLTAVLADATSHTNFGWAIDLADMQSTADAKRVIPAGTWTVQLLIGANVASLVSATVRARIYRVASVAAGRGRTQIGAEGTISAGLLTAAGGTFTLTIASMPEVTLEDGETILLSMAVTCTGQVGGLQSFIRLGGTVANARLHILVPAPGIRTKVLTSIIATAVGLVTIARSYGKGFIVAAVGLATIARRLTGARVISATAVGLANIIKRVGKTISATAVGVVTINKRIFKAITAIAVGLVTISKRINKNITNIAVGLATVTRKLVSARIISATAVGVAFFQRALIFGRRIIATAIGKVQIRANMDIKNIPPSEGGGGTTIIKKIIHIFDD